MFDFLKKNKNLPPKTENKPKEDFSDILSFRPPAADAAAIFDNNIQRTLKDIVVIHSPLGAEINVATDSLGGYDVKKLEQFYNYDPNILGTEKILAAFQNINFIGFQLCSILNQNWLINKCCALPPKEAAAVEYDIIFPENSGIEDPLKLISELKIMSSDCGKFKINEAVRTFAENKRIFGQALAIPIVEGADMSIPFNIDAVKKGSYKGMCIIEPQWVTAVVDIEGLTNPKSLRYYKPTYFRLPNGEYIHYTWFIFNTYSEVKDILKPTYYFGGLPLPQLLYEAVYAAQKTGNEAPMLAMTKRLNYIECNLNGFLMKQDLLQPFFNAIAWIRNNFGFLALKKDQRVGQFDTSLADFDSVVMLQYQLCAAIAGVQAVKLLETSPKGWQSSGNIEQANYKQLLKSIQNDDLIPILDKHYTLLAKSEFDIVAELSCVYGEIDTPTEKERAEINEINSRTAMNYVNAGAVSPDEIRNILREDTNSAFNALEGDAPNDPIDFDPDNDPDNDSFNDNAATDDEWNETDHPRKPNGQFGEGGGNVEKSQRSDKIRKRTRKKVQLPKDEYAKVIHELNTNLPSELKNKKIFRRSIGNHTYKIQNNGFNEYKIIGKQEINEMFY